MSELVKLRATAVRQALARRALDYEYVLWVPGQPVLGVWVAKVELG